MKQNKKSKIVHKVLNPIHIKLEYEEAVESKKDILSAQMSIIQINKSMKRYNDLRMQELKTKLRMHKKIKEIIKEINSLQKTLPEIRIPRFLYNKENEQPEHNKEKVLQPIISKFEQKDKDLESELKEIQEKLRILQRR